jgi:hypothetical protein
LEDVRPGAKLEGLLAVPVTVVAATFQGTNALEVVFRTADGIVDTDLLFRDHEPTLRLVQDGSTWGFDGDAGMLQLALEARRIRLAHLFDPYLAVHLSQIDALLDILSGLCGHIGDVRRTGVTPESLDRSCGSDYSSFPHCKQLQPEKDYGA